MSGVQYGGNHWVAGVTVLIFSGYGGHRWASTSSSLFWLSDLKGPHIPLYQPKAGALEKASRQTGHFLALKKSLTNITDVGLIYSSNKIKRINCLPIQTVFFISKMETFLT